MGRRDFVNKHSSLRAWVNAIVTIGGGSAAVFSVLAVVFTHDDNAHYFVSGSKIFPISVICAVLAFAAAIVYAFVISKEEFASSSPFGTRPLFTLPATLGFGASAVLSIVEFAKTQSALFLIAAIFLLLSTAYLLVSETERANTFLGFAPPIACALLIGVLYFDISLEMNAPLKVVAQCALLPLMLYFTAELRYLLNREIPRLYLALAFCSIAASSLCVLAVPLASFVGMLGNTNSCMVAALTVAGANVTILLKLKRYLQPTPSPENDTKETDAQ